MASTISTSLTTDGEARTPAKTAWSSTVAGLAIAGLAIAGAVRERLSPTMQGKWVFATFAVIFTLVAAYTILAVWTSRWRLLPDRVEIKVPFRRRSLSRAEIKGLRALSQDTIHLETAEGRGHGLSVPLHVTKNPVWAAWLETLTNLDAVDYNTELAALEQDERLGATPSLRMETLTKLRRLAAFGAYAGVGLALWLWFYPHPYGTAMALNIAAPLVALVVANRWPGLVALMGDQNAEPTVSVAALWFAPSSVLAIRALRDIHEVDWIQPLGVGCGLALIPFLLALRVQRSAKHPAIALFLAVISVGWGWGAISLVNWFLDEAPPVIHRAVVTDRSGSDDDSPSLSLRVADADATAPPIQDLRVSRARFKASPLGAQACVAVYPGRLGWRYVTIADCPDTAARH